MAPAKGIQACLYLVSPGVENMGGPGGHMMSKPRKQKKAFS